MKDSVIKNGIEDRMKFYEHSETERVFSKKFPLYIRLDGRGFEKFTKNMERSFDMRFSLCMQQTAIELVKSTNAAIAYIKSDEISLIIPPANEPNQQFLFDGRVQKLHSVLAGLASSAFMMNLVKHFKDNPSILEKMPHFDCRAMSMPSKSEAVNALAWRVINCRRNAILMIAQSQFPQKMIHRKKTDDLIQMLKQAKHSISDYSSNDLYGVFVKRQEFIKSGKVHQDVYPFSMPYFLDIENREDMVFQSNPILKMKDGIKISALNYESNVVEDI